MRRTFNLPEGQTLSCVPKDEENLFDRHQILGFYRDHIAHVERVTFHQPITVESFEKLKPYVLINPYTVPYNRVLAEVTDMFKKDEENSWQVWLQPKLTWNIKNATVSLVSKSDEQIIRKQLWDLNDPAIEIPDPRAVLEFTRYLEL